MRKNAITNPINYVLKNNYGLSIPQLAKIRTECVKAVSQLRTNRGSAAAIQEILEKNFPDIKTYFPINNWEQRKPLANGKYGIIIVAKDYESSLNAYVKSINVEVGTSFGKKARRTESKLCEHFNINQVEQPVPTVNLDNETIQILDYALSKGAKLFRKGDLEIQF